MTGPEDAIRSAAAGLERDCRKLGKSLLDSGEEIPAWLWNDLTLFIRLQGEEWL